MAETSSRASRAPTSSASSRPRGSSGGAGGGVTGPRVQVVGTGGGTGRWRGGVRAHGRRSYRPGAAGRQPTKEGPLATRAVTLCGVHDLEIVIASLLVSVAVLNAVASRLQVPYPIVLVLGGLLLGFVPGMPDIELEPDLVLLVFLPPLLFVAAYRSDVRALRYQARALALTSIGLVLVTIGAVAVAGHEVMGLEWPIAFAPGALVSPTDPVAATAIMQRLGAPRRIVTAVEGESLVNDTAALIGYRVAVAVALGEGFSMLDAS